MRTARSAAISLFLFWVVVPFSQAQAPPTARAWLGGAAINNTLLTAGGGTCGGCSGFGGSEIATVEAYETTLNAWSTKSSLESPRFGLSASTSNGSVFAIGGTFGSSSSALSTVEAYDPGTNTWSTKTSMPTARWKLTTSSVNGVIYAIGGGPGGNQCIPTGIVEAYDTTADTWSSKSSMPTPRWGAASDVINGSIYVVGGSLQCPQIIVTPSATLEVYDPTADSWASAMSMPTARWDLAAVGVSGKLYAIGGWDPIGQKSLSTVEAYDPGTNAWTAKSSMPTARTGLAAVNVNGKIYAFGGSDGTNVLGTLEIYDPTTDTWTMPPTRFLSFPLPNRTSQTAKINTVFDHSMTFQYCADGTVTAYDGEEGRSLYGSSFVVSYACKGKKNKLYGFQQNGGGAFSINGQYSGDTTYLNYDGHPGYDFRTKDQDPKAGEIPVLAAAGGSVICVNISTKTVPPCTEGPGEIKIDHGNGYFTIYLHLSFPNVSAGDSVSRLQQIGVSGDTGVKGNPHLHFEVRQGATGSQCPVSTCVPVDPYGWTGTGTDAYTRTQNYNLWQ